MRFLSGAPGIQMFVLLPIFLKGWKTFLHFLIKKNFLKNHFWNWHQIFDWHGLFGAFIFRMGKTKTLFALPVFMKLSSHPPTPCTTPDVKKKNESLTKKKKVNVCFYLFHYPVHLRQDETTSIGNPTDLIRLFELVYTAWSVITSSMETLYLSLM